MKTKLLIGLISFFGIVNAQYSKLYDFASTPDGSNPNGTLFFDGTFLYGMTYHGGVNDKGTLFKIMPGGTGYSKLLDFANDTLHGVNPYASIISDGTFLYGMTPYGGLHNEGTIFKIKPDGTEYSKLLDFANDTLHGRNPYGSLFFDGTFLYGMTQNGGAKNIGTIFKIKPDGTGYIKLLDCLDTASGAFPSGSLISDGIFLYGMTYGGGTNGEGIIFKIKPDGTEYSKLLDFSFTATGRFPYGSLISDGTFLYGMTVQGGINNAGVVFKIKLDGTGFIKLLDCSGTNGHLLYGDLIYDGTFLYGMTRKGGTNDYGTLFEIKTDGSGYVKLLDFTGAANGMSPEGSLVSDGTFLYGMTKHGGTNDAGVIFKYALRTSIAENNMKMDFTISPNPFVSQTTLKTDQTLNNPTLTVYNSFGQPVKQLKNISSQEIIFYRENLPAGLYFFQLSEGNLSDTQAGKFVITDN